MRGKPVSLTRLLDFRSALSGDRMAMRIILTVGQDGPAIATIPMAVPAEMVGGMEMAVEEAMAA
jgi:hypothetical protein